MERLTNHFDYCKFIDCKFYDAELFKQGKCKFFDESIERCHEKRMNDKLREYEDLEEQGTLIRLPCNVEDIVYRIDSYAKGIISPMRVWKVVFTKAYGEYSNIEIYAIDMKNSGRYAFFAREINKAVFLTREEAESVLERMNENA